MIESLPVNNERRITNAVHTLVNLPAEEIQARGHHFRPNHFYTPLNDIRFLRENRDLWHDREPIGIEWNDSDQFALAERIGRFRPELEGVPREPKEDEPTAFAWKNPAFTRADAIALYGMVRLVKPRRIVEIGCGWSTLLVSKAVERNGNDADVTLIEPNPDRDLLADLPRAWHRHERIVQREPLETFTGLKSGDILLFDGSHCVHTASDATWFVLEILPRLKPGVLVHIHDIFWPSDYNDEWLLDDALSWNEQYLLQAFLMFNRLFQVRLANFRLCRLDGARMAKLYDHPEPWGGGVWIERVDG